MSKFFFLISVVVFTQASAQRSASVFYRASPQASFAVDKVVKSLTSQGYSVVKNPKTGTPAKNEALRIVLATAENLPWIKSLTNVVLSYSDKLDPEGFTIQHIKDKSTSTILSLVMTWLVYYTVDWS